MRAELPLNDPQNVTAPGYVKPYELAMRLCEIAEPDAIVLPCSSGGAASVSMQALQLRAEQKLVGDKSLAAMGYGLSGAIGVALANPGRQVFLSEGDGGFAQNVQELGTLAATGANVKVFLLENNGYASIRMTQRNYFKGAWIGCDAQTGLGLPNWEDLARAYRIPYRPTRRGIRPGCPVCPLAAGSGWSGAHRGADRPRPDLLPEDQLGGAARRFDEVEPTAPDESRPAGRGRRAGDHAPRRCGAASLDCELSAIRVIRIPSPQPKVGLNC